MKQRTVKQYYYKTMFNHIQKEGKEVLYTQKAYFPILEIDTIVREKSKDQLGDIQQALLGFINDGLHLTTDIGKMLGFPSPNKVTPLLEELRGQGLIQKEKDGYYNISELGQKSLELGVAVVDVPRAFLICGKTGRLMPKEVYSIDRLDSAQFKYISQQSILIDSAMDIPLKYLDISILTDKKAYNISDEATEILSCEETTPKFIQTTLVINKDQGKEQTELSVNNASIDWLDDTQILSLVEPLGWGTKYTQKDIVRMIQEKLQTLGFIDVFVNIDTYKTIIVNFSDASDEALRTPFELEPLLAYIGTASIPSISINKFPINIPKGERQEDWLRGYVIKLETPNPVIAKNAILFRLDFELNELYFQAKREKAISYKTKFLPFAKEELKKRDISFEDILQNVSHYGNDFRKQKYKTSK